MYYGIVQVGNCLCFDLLRNPRIPPPPPLPSQIHRSHLALWIICITFLLTPTPPLPGSATNDYDHHRWLCPQYFSPKITPLSFLLPILIIPIKNKRKLWIALLKVLDQGPFENTLKTVSQKVWKRNELFSVWFHYFFVVGQENSEITHALHRGLPRDGCATNMLEEKSTTRQGLICAENSPLNEVLPFPQGNNLPWAHEPMECYPVSGK